MDSEYSDWEDLTHLVTKCTHSFALGFPCVDRLTNQPGWQNVQPPVGVRTPGSLGALEGSPQSISNDTTTTIPPTVIMVNMELVQVTDTCPLATRSVLRIL